MLNFYLIQFQDPIKRKQFPDEGLLQMLSGNVGESGKETVG